MNKILLTGGSGFVGGKCFDAISLENSIVPVVRTNQGLSGEAVVDTIDSNTDWSFVLQGCRTAIHCAARVHVMSDDAEDPLQAFREVNVEGTKNLARQAASVGVKRFIFLSSIKVNGEFSGNSLCDNGPFVSSDTSKPADAYGISKCEAEDALKAICRETGMEYVIIRPPLVYGAGVKANFLSMLKWVSRGVPLPLGGIRRNKRSLVYVENLVDLIKECLENPAAANQTFLVSDNEDVSTRELLERVANALGVTSRLLPIPPSWFGFLGRLIGRKDVEQRLCGSLHVDIEHTKKTLGWKPPYSMEEGLVRTAEWYNKQIR